MRTRTPRPSRATRAKMRANPPTAAIGAELAGPGYLMRALGTEARPVAHVRCDSPQAMAALAQHVCDVQDTRWGDSASSMSSRADGRSQRWDLGVDFDGAQAMIAAGAWDYALDRMRESRAQMTPIAAPRGSIAPRLGFVGFRPNVATWLGGNPACMQRMAEGAVARAMRPVLTIRVSLSMPSACDAQKAQELAVRILRVAEAAERSGVRVAIDGYSASEYLHAHVRIKAPDAPANLGLLSVMIHPAVMRHTKFALIESAASLVMPSASAASYYLNNYGASTDPEPAPGCATLGYMNWFHEQPEHAERRMLNELQGV